MGMLIPGLGVYPQNPPKNWAPMNINDSTVYAYMMRINTHLKRSAPDEPVYDNMQISWKGQSLNWAKFWVKTMIINRNWIKTIKWLLLMHVLSSSVCIPVLMYWSPSAKVKAISRTASAPASCMWYPEIEMELNFGMCCN